MVLHDERGELVGPFLLKGRPEKGMPAYPNLTESQTYDIAQFLHLQVELAANRGTYKRLNVVSGDAKKGEAYFKGAGKCNTCHSITGDLAKIGSKYPPDVIQNRFLWPGGGGFGAPAYARKATVTLPDGRTVTGSLVPGRACSRNVDAAPSYVELPERAGARTTATVNVALSSLQRGEEEIE